MEQQASLNTAAAIVYLQPRGALLCALAATDKVNRNTKCREEVHLGFPFLRHTRLSSWWLQQLLVGARHGWHLPPIVTGAMLAIIMVYNPSFDRPSCNLVLINLTPWSIKADVNMARFLNNNTTKGII